MANVTVTRTTHGFLVPCRGAAACPIDRFVLTIALKDANIAFSDSRGIVLKGLMAAGTVYVAAPSQKIEVTFAGPCDLLHLSVLTSFWEEQISLAGFGSKRNRRVLDRLVVRDRVIEQLGALLGDTSADWPPPQIESLSQVVIARLARLLPRREPRTPLPLWRLRKVEALIERDIAAPLRLPDLAAVAGLSRMHFAAQFRIATGYRPHEYILIRRIEYAKSLIDRNKMSLVEIALDAGFQSQAHFCTIFKRMTGTTPSSWRQQRDASNLSLPAPVASAETEPRIEPIFERSVARVSTGIRFDQIHAWRNDRPAMHAA